MQRLATSEYNFDTLRDNARTVTRLRRRTVHGVEAIGYRLVMHRSAMTMLGELVFGRLPSRTRDRLPKRMTLDMWVDDDLEPVRVSYTMREGGERHFVTETYFDRGVPISIALPPEAQVTTPPSRPPPPPIGR